MKKRILLIGILVALVAAVAGGGWFGYKHFVGSGGGEAFGEPFTLVDQKGAEITEQAFRGQPTALFFGFTHCPEVCPTTLVELDAWLAKLGDEGRDIRAYFITVDPERDTAETMDVYVGNVSKRIVGITGDPAKVMEMAKAFKIYSRKVPLDGGDYTMDHTASILLLDRHGGFFGTIAYGEDPETAVAKLKRLVAEG